MKMVLTKYRIFVYESGKDSIRFAFTATGFTEEEAIRKISTKFTGEESLTNPNKFDFNKYPLTFKAVKDGRET